MGIYYHGTSSKRKNQILNEGFKLTNDVVNGKHFGNYVYFTPNLQEAEDYGESVIKVEIDDSLLNVYNSLDDYNSKFLYNNNSEKIGFSLFHLGDNIVAIRDVSKIRIIR